MSSWKGLHEWARTQLESLVQTQDALHSFHLFFLFLPPLVPHLQMQPNHLLYHKYWTLSNDIIQYIFIHSLVGKWTISSLDTSRMNNFFLAINKQNWSDVFVKLKVHPDESDAVKMQLILTGCSFYLLHWRDRLSPRWYLKTTNNILEVLIKTVTSNLMEPFGAPRFPSNLLKCDLWMSKCRGIAQPVLAQPLSSASTWLPAFSVLLVIRCVRVQWGQLQQKVIHSFLSLSPKPIKDEMRCCLFPSGKMRFQHKPS